MCLEKSEVGIQVLRHAGVEWHPLRHGSDGPYGPSI